LDILVLGVGNVLLTDEGIGIRGLKELERRYNFSDEVELLDGGTAGIELLRHIRKLQERMCRLLSVRGYLHTSSDCQTFLPQPC
jgi:hydrogenase maturation protease